MKRITILVVLLLLVTSSCFAAWTKVVETDAGYFSVKDESIKHYVSAGGFDATSGVFNWYSYGTRTEISTVVNIRDSDLLWVELSSCTWRDGIKTGCTVVEKSGKAIRGSNGETIFRYMVNYNRTYRGRDKI